MHSKWWLWCFDCKLFHIVYTKWCELWTWTTNMKHELWSTQSRCAILIFSVHGVHTPNKASHNEGIKLPIRAKYARNSQNSKCLTWMSHGFSEMCLPPPLPPSVRPSCWRSIRFHFVSFHPIHPSVSTFHNGLVKTVLCTIFKCFLRKTHVAMHGIEFHFILCFGKWNRFQGQHSCKHCRVNFNSNFALWTEPTQWSSVFWAHAISLFFDSTKRLSHSKLISCSSIASDWWFPQSAWISASVDQCSSSHFQFLTPPTRCPTNQQIMYRVYTVHTNQIVCVSSRLPLRASLEKKQKYAKKCVKSYGKIVLC